MQEVVSLKISSNLKNIAQIERLLENWKEEHNISDDKFGNILLASVEAVTNAMEHGNKWDPEKMVSVSVTKNASHLNISVSDEGVGFVCVPSSNTCSETEALTLRGRGIKIIRQFCRPRWNDRGNRIELIIDLL